MVGSATEMMVLSRALAANGAVSDPVVARRSRPGLRWARFYVVADVAACGITMKCRNLIGVV